MTFLYAFSDPCAGSSVIGKYRKASAPLLILQNYRTAESRTRSHRKESKRDIEVARLSSVF
jgi:hypothetical protein